MATTTLRASTRTGKGKGAARSMRRAGRIPAVVYGHHRETEALELDATVVERLVGGLKSSSTMIDLTVDDRPAVRTLIREVQRDPLRPQTILHLDLYEVRADEKITVEVPVHLTGVPDGVRNFAGVLDHLMHKLEIEVLPADMPESIDIDVTHLGIADVIFVRDVTVPNAEILNDPDQAVCTVVPPRVEEAPAAEVAAEEMAEPELIRKPKAEEEAPEAEE